MFVEPILLSPGLQSGLGSTVPTQNVFVNLYALQRIFGDGDFGYGAAIAWIFVVHHHLLPVPGTGRERSTVMDAGDLLEVLIRSGVNVVLSGHKHVPYVWRLETIYIANAGTVASLRLRGHTKPCYNVLEFEGDEVKISRRYPFGGQTVLAHFSLSTGHQYYRELEQLIQQPVQARSGGALE